ncbi:hypothetical protein Bca52824_032211 [Brassica carinata]|uniref:V-type proton ATPase subunit a n=1 Tax=Brassica carinata TaxID=52824 RepID=A0A8X7SBK4_BRACI|nr:hypothetical protein Bca52824_032211 [Brassica carinata]
MSQNIRFFKDQMSKVGVSPKEFLEKEVDMDLDNVEVKLGELEAEISKFNANNDKLQRSYNDLVEYKLLLDKGPSAAVAEITRRLHRRVLGPLPPVPTGQGKLAAVAVLRPPVPACLR